MAEIISTGKSRPELNREQELSLSLTESGCFIFETPEEICLILNDTEDMISSLKSLKSARLKFSSVMKIEFPNINLEILLKTQNGLSRKFEYFFMAESELDISLLQKIGEQGILNTYLSDGNKWSGFKFGLLPEEIESLNTSIREMGPVLTKNSL